MASTAPTPGSPASAFPSPAPSASYTSPPPPQATSPPPPPDTTDPFSPLSPPPPSDTTDPFSPPSPPPPPDTTDPFSPLSPPPPPDTTDPFSPPSPPPPPDTTDPFPPPQPVALAPSPSNLPPPPSPGPPPAESPAISPPPPSPFPPVPAAAENSSSAGSGGGLSTALVATIGAVAGLLVLALIVIVLFLRMRKRKVSQLSGVCAMPPSRGSSRETEGVSYGSDFVSASAESGGVSGNSRPWFTYEELSKATDGFPAQNLLGQGGFGSVYKGTLVDGREVAVKQLKVGGGQGEREFRAEVEIISRIHHRHLVSLVGYCISESRRLLVYDYVPNKTLYFHLHGEGKEVMDWATRLKVAAGAAHGIAYLHEDCRPRVIHRDIKSSNILLDNNFEARVSDFGLAKLDFDANTHISTRVMGTFGYMAPEYTASGQLTEKSDVYSLGVVLLEIITGRQPVDTSQPLGHQSVVEWARPSLSHVLENNEFDILVDPRLEQNYDQSQMIQMIEVAAACVRHSAIKRPRMGQVVRALDSITGVDYQWNKVGRKRNML